VRTIGYAIDKEEDEIGGRCIAAPIFDASGARAAAIGLSGIVSQVPDERIPVLGELVRSAADVISTRLGYQTTKQRSPESHRTATPSSSKNGSRV
jgi:DNA-binding IclR family transcriptional regulator